MSRRWSRRLWLCRGQLEGAGPAWFAYVAFHANLATPKALPLASPSHSPVWMAVLDCGPGALRAQVAAQGWL